MAARRGKSQAKRNGGNSNPAWIWLFAGLALGIALIVGVPKLWPKGDGDGFFRPKPNPGCAARSTTSAEDDDAIVPEDRAVAGQGRQAEGNARTTSTRCCPPTRCRCPTPSSPKPRAPKSAREAAAATAGGREPGRRRHRAAGHHQQRQRHAQHAAAGHDGRVGDQARSRRTTARATCCRPARSRPAAMPKR